MYRNNDITHSYAENVHSAAVIVIILQYYARAQILYVLYSCTGDLTAVGRYFVRLSSYVRYIIAVRCCSRNDEIFTSYIIYPSLPLHGSSVYLRTRRRESIRIEW